MQPAGASKAQTNWALLFVLIGGIVGLAFAFTTPSVGGTDEAQHLTRVALIDQGWLVPPTHGSVADAPHDYVLDGCFDAELADRVLTSLGDDIHHWSAQFHNAPCGPTGAGRVDLATPANVYSLVPYLPALVGFRAGRAVDGAVGSIYGARIAQLAAFLALMWFAIRSTPWGKPLFFTLGLLPVVLQGAAAVSADPITNGLAFCVVALVLSLVDRSRTGTASTRDLVVLGAVVAGLALSKSAYVPFALLVLAVPTAAFGSTRRRVRSLAAILAVAVALGGRLEPRRGEPRAHRGGPPIRLDGGRPLDPTASRRLPRGHRGGWSNHTELSALLHGFFIPIRRFHHNPSLPLVVTFAWLAIARLVDPIPGLRRRRAVVTSASAGEGGPGAEPTSGGDRALGQPEGAPAAIPLRDRLSSAALAAAIAVMVVLLIEYGLAIAANPPGAHKIVWVQGRYFLPLLPLTLFGFSGIRSRQLPERLLLALPAVSAAFATWWLWYVAHTAYGWL